ncbi:MAG: hypothetical protein U1A78_29055 [Polyangia bacterium]
MDAKAGPNYAPSEAVQYDCVLVDDDELVHLTWRLAAERAGVRLLTLASAEAALDHIPALAKHTALYIDVKLRGGLSGEQLAYRLHQEGFSNLFLQTGYDVSTIPAQAMPWLKGIVGKEPPWPDAL